MVALSAWNFPWHYAEKWGAMPRPALLPLKCFLYDFFIVHFQTVHSGEIPSIFYHRYTVVKNSILYLHIFLKKKIKEKFKIDN